MLSKDKLRSLFNDAIKKITNSNEITIGDDENFQDYGLDSLDRMNLLLEMEETTGYDLNEINLSDTNTFNLFFDAITKHATKDN